LRSPPPKQRIISEWELELLAKEAILNAGRTGLNFKSLRTWKNLATTIDELRRLENELYKLRKHRSPTEDIFLELVRIAHRQFIWQGDPPNPITAIRHFKIFDEPRISKICEKHIGLSVRKNYLCGLMLWGLYLERPAVSASFNLNLKKISRAEFDKFLKFTCSDIDTLKSLLESEQCYDENFVYAYNSLRQFPLIKMPYHGEDAIVCPLPTLLFWRITGGLYYEMRHDPRFAIPFGHSFQSYIGEVLKRVCLSNEISIISEMEYGSRKHRKQSVDWIVSDAQSALLIECKAKRLTWNAKVASEGAASLHEDIDKLAESVVQVYKSIRDYQADKYPDYPFQFARKIYPVVVTTENWHLFGGLMPNRLRDAVEQKLKNENIPTGCLSDMPYSIWAAEELEAGMQLLNSMGIQRFMDGKLTDPEMNTWEWHAYISNISNKRTPRNLFTDEFQSIFKDIN